jgi:hypothetical protein
MAELKQKAILIEEGKSDQKMAELQKKVEGLKRH